MEFIASTISEHIFHEGELKGKAAGNAEGEAKGKVEGQIDLLEKLYQQGMLPKNQYQRMIRPLRKQLAELVGSI